MATLLYLIYFGIIILVLCINTNRTPNENYFIKIAITTLLGASVIVQTLFEIKLG